MRIKNISLLPSHLMSEVAAETNLGASMLGKVPWRRPRALQKREWNFWRFRRRISLITSSEPIRVRSLSQLVNNLWEISIFLFSTDIRAICEMVVNHQPKHSNLFKSTSQKYFPGCILVQDIQKIS